MQLLRLMGLSRVMTRLNGDLRWIWNKLQVKHPVGLSSLQINKVEEPIDIKDNEDEVWEIIKIQKREEKVCLPSCHQSRELVHQIADLQFTSTNTGLSNGYSTLCEVVCETSDELTENDDDINDREDEYLRVITPTLMGKVKDDTSNNMVTQLEISFLLTRRVKRVRKREKSDRL